MKTSLSFYLVFILLMTTLKFDAQTIDFTSFTNAFFLKQGDETLIEDRTIYKATQLLNLGIQYYSNGIVRESIECFEKADSIFVSLGKTDDHTYTLTYLYATYFEMGDKEKYDSTRKELIKIKHENNVRDETIKKILYLKIGQFYEDDGYYEDAVNIYKELFMDTCYYDIKPQEKFSFLYRLTSIYIKMGDIKSASLYLNELKDIMKSYNVNSEDFFGEILIESSFLLKQGLLGKAAQLLERYAEKLESEFGIYNHKAVYYDTLGRLYITVGNLKQALAYSQKALEMCKKNNGVNSSYYATSLLNISDIYGLLGNHSKALEITTEACNIMERLYTKNHPEYYYALKKLAGIYLNIDESKAKQTFNTCLNLSRSIFGEDSIEYGDMLINCNLNLTLNPSDEEIAKVEEGIGIKRKNGCFDEVFLSDLKLFSIMLFIKQDWPMLYEIANETLERARDYVTSNFRHLSSSQRDALWKNVKSVLDGMESYATNHNHWAVENQKFDLVNNYSELAYDVRLLKKGLLLTSAQSLEKLINNSDNPDVINIRKQLDILGKNLKNAEIEEKENIQRNINNLERELISIASHQGDFLDFTNIHWQDIQNVLMPGEVAIEFFSFPCQNDTQYGMSFVGSDGFPLTLGLFMESELTKFRKKETAGYDYNNTELYDKIWAVLETFSDIRNVHNIYFSADGILNNLAIENLIDSTGVIASSKRNLIRVSSTRELLKKNDRPMSPLFQEKEGVDIVLYGGLDYDMTIEDLKKQIQQINKQIETYSCEKERSLNLDNLRSGVTYLPGTLTEIENIARYFNNIPIIQTGKSGTEDSFKALAGNSLNVLHLATHGFFWSKETAETPHNLRFLQNYNEISVEEQAMLRSGLLFSGANISLKGGDDLPDYVEDGILTARELAILNFGKINLVVLSACESGLGDNTEEGVFGLQRGFKLAGAETILMSLWKVDDTATQMLMTEFYRNLMSGQSKQESLLNAQKAVRDFPGHPGGRKYPYEDPKYWAAFILLDALN